jgi:predicted metal-dependent hydrolase
MELSYQIVRSARRKKLTITVERDRTVIVHAPMKATEGEICGVVETKRAWLFEKLHHAQKYQDRPHAPGKEIVNGESALYLGREYRIELAATASGVVEFTRGFEIPPGLRGNRRTVLKAWYQERAERIILPRVNVQARELGVVVGEARIVDNRYRWGSCTVKNGIHLNWRLIKAPLFVIDYVIVHELAHVMETNHTPRFWNIVKAKSAAAEKAKAWLKAHGQMLEEEV